MLRSGLLASPIASLSPRLSALHRLSHRTRLASSSSSSKKKNMAGEGTPQGFSRTRPSPRSPSSGSSGKLSSCQDDGIYKNSNAIRSAKSAGSVGSVKSPQTTLGRHRPTSPWSVGSVKSSQTIVAQHSQTSPESIGSSTLRRPQSDAEIQPFDICKTKVAGPVKLNKSLFEVNRAKRKESERSKVVPQHSYLRSGMILLKNYIGHDDQVKIIQKCRELGVGSGGFYIPGYRDGAKLCLHMMCLGMNWDPQSRLYDMNRPVDGAKPPKIPMDFIKLVNGSIQSSHDFLNTKIPGVNAEAEVPKMSPDICIVNFYNNNGRLGLHQDRDERKESLCRGLPVVSFSLGDTAKFLYGDERDADKAKEVELESGDVLIFGGNSRHIFHGVSSVIPNTAPRRLIEDTHMLPGRLNLTFRKY